MGVYPGPMSREASEILAEAGRRGADLAPPADVERSSDSSKTPLPSWPDQPGDFVSFDMPMGRPHIEIRLDALRIVAGQSSHQDAASLVQEAEKLMSFLTKP